MAKQFDKLTKRLLLKKPNEQKVFDDRLLAEGSHMPEDKGHFVELGSLLYAMTGIEVSEDAAKKHSMERSVAFLGSSGKTYILQGNHIIDEVTFTKNGEVALKRDDTIAPNRDAFHTNIDGFVTTSNIRAATGTLRKIRHENVVIACEATHRLSSMLHASATEVRQATEDRPVEAPLVSMTLHSGQEKALIIENPGSPAPYMFSNGPTLKPLIVDAIQSIKKSPIFQALVGGVSLAAITIGSLAMTGSSLLDYNPSVEGPPITQVMYDEDTGHIDIAQIQGNEVTVLRNLNGGRSFEEMQGSINDEFFASIASNAAANSTEFTGAHVEKAMLDTEELRHNWSQKFGESATVMMKMFRNDDVVTIESDGATIKTAFNHVNQDSSLTGEPTSYMASAYIGDYGASERSMDVFLDTYDARDRQFKEIVFDFSESIAPAISAAGAPSAITSNVTSVSNDLVDQEVQELNASQADRSPHTFSVEEGYDEIAKLLGPDLSVEYGAELETSQGMELAQQFAAMSFDDDTDGKMVTMGGEQLEVAMDQTTQIVEMKGDRVAIDPSSMSIHPDNRVAIQFDESMVTDNSSTPGMSR
ncbi:hypothetical protein [Salipiger sp. PrR003]|uniref:hypothetical protein n=1 Tax=Salipiger sp. PrR003 TaxID=2706776 RepID=UPI0013D93EC7|nr:hypothetical protein [Salipiger sp. PrR003]NDV50540.1 hypothetical protein [Salipiger sp. PrR003]